MLTPRQRAVVDALLPSGAHPTLPGALEAGFEAFHAEFERTASPRLRWGFKAALWIAAWLSPLLIGRLPPLSRLEQEARENALEALGRSRFYLLRQALLLLKATVCFGYGANPKVRRALGIPA